MGSIDRGFGPLAGLDGFKPPDKLSAEDAELYRTKVVNVPYTPAMAAYGFSGSHTSAATSPAFVRAKIAPIVLAHACAAETAGRPPRPAAPAPSCPTTTGIAAQGHLAAGADEAG